MLQSAVVMDSAALSCPWPRTMEYSSAASSQGQGIVAGLKQVRLTADQAFDVQHAIPELCTRLRCFP